MNTRKSKKITFVCEIETLIANSTWSKFKFTDDETKKLLDDDHYHYFTLYALPMYINIRWVEYHELGLSFENKCDEDAFDKMQLNKIITDFIGSPKFLEIITKIGALDIKSFKNEQDLIDQVYWDVCECTITSKYKQFYFTRADMAEIEHVNVNKMNTELEERLSFLEIDLALPDYDLIGYEGYKIFKKHSRITNLADHFINLSTARDQK